MNPRVDWFFDKPNKWQDAYQELRTLLLSVGLTEELKWSQPCYTFNKGNVVLIHGFKEYCALLFMKGALMKDPDKLLVQQTDNVQAARQIRFSNVDEIVKRKTAIETYIKNAIEIEKSGAKVELKKTIEYKMPEEFQTALNEVTMLQAAFNKLTPGRQKGYLLYFSSAKQAKTRIERINKYLPKIMDGNGLDD